MRRLLLPVFALLLVVAAACGDDGGSTQDDDETFDPPPTTEARPSNEPEPPGAGPAPDIDDLPSGSVVFSPDDAPSNVDGEPTTWTPSIEDIEAVEELLAIHLDANPELGVENFGNYVRQYVGTGEVGELVSANAVCDPLQWDWEDELVAVDDGGNCYWQAEVSFRTLQIESFQVNGAA